MKVVEIGMLARTHADSGLPEHGIVIEATENELRNMALNILYNDVKIDIVELPKRKGDAK